VLFLGQKKKKKKNSKKRSLVAASDSWTTRGLLKVHAGTGQSLLPPLSLSLSPPPRR
jgi:hypothetical protein